MKKTVLIALAACAGLSLSACGSKATPSANEAAPAEKPSPSVGGTGVGTVTAIDPAGKVTIDHGAIPEAGWPAMVMTFGADPALLQNLAVGEKVKFHMTAKGMSAKVTAIERQ